MKKKKIFIIIFLIIIISFAIIILNKNNTVSKENYEYNFSSNEEINIFKFKYSRKCKRN